MINFPTLFHLLITFFHISPLIDNLKSYQSIVIIGFEGDKSNLK